LHLLLESKDGPSSLLRDFTVPLDGLELILILHAPDFRIYSQRTQRLHLPLNGNSNWILWEIEPFANGTFPISVSAYNGAAYLGEIALSVKVTESLTRTESAEVERRTALATRDAGLGEATLSIRYDAREQVFRYHFLFPQEKISEEMNSEFLSRPPHEFVEFLVRDLNLSSGGQTNYNSEQTLTLLRGKGRDLWRQLIPPRLQELFWQHCASIERLTVLAQGDNVPWELLYPTDDNTSSRDQGFLAEQLSLVRWIHGSAPSTLLSLNNAYFVLPEEARSCLPATAGEEINALKRLIGTTNEDIRHLQGLLDCLKQADFDLLHFACHNTFTPSSPSSSSIQMGSQKFTPDFLEGLNSDFTSRRPLVFINACRSAGRSSLYTGLSGWADKFLRAGAGAFTGTSWDVRDTSAAIFAEVFYKSLLQGETLGSAMSAGRSAIQNQNGDSTWLAYTLYGDPDARLSSTDVL